MHEFGLKFLQSSLGLLALRKIANKSGEIALLAGFISPTASSIGKVDPSRRSPTTTRPMPMMRRSPGASIPGEITIVIFAIG